MLRKIVAVWVSLVMLFGFVVIVDVVTNITPTVRAATLYVNETGSGGAYTSIQDAINASSNGDTVFVYNGTYYENVEVNKTINLTGEDRDSTIIEGVDINNVIYVNADWVNVSCLFIANGSKGIHLDSSNNILTQNNISNNEYGIYLNSSSSNTIYNNSISSINTHGIQMVSSSMNTISNNIVNGKGIGYGLMMSSSSSNRIITNSISYHGSNVYINDSSNYNHFINNSFNNSINCGIQLIASSYNSFISNSVCLNNYYGIYVHHWANYNNFTSNSIHSNGYDGIAMSFSVSFNNITGNSIYLNNRDGIIIATSDNNIITKNLIHSNDRVGIHMAGSSFNNIENNNIYSNNIAGVKLNFSSNNNNIRGNSIYSTINFGIMLGDSSDNILHHNNIINNMIQVYMDTTSYFNNIWEDGFGEGNFWSDYNGLDDGSGSRTAGDGVGDTMIPHPSFDQGNGYYQLDNYPLMNLAGNFLWLREGWNLISIPLIQKEQNLTRVLGSIYGWYDAVQLYDITDKIDPWKHHKIGKPFGNDLSEINETMSFWIHITQPGDTIFLYNGTQPSVNQTIPLHPGWNMVGYPSLTNHNRTEGLNNLEFGPDVDCIQWYDTPTKTWHFMGPDDPFVPERGYWVHSKVDAGWEVPL